MSSKYLAILIVIAILAGTGLGVAVGHYVYHSAQKETKPLTVFAAGSLTLVLNKSFYPRFKNLTGITVLPTFGGSVAGANEIDAGTPFDVFISAAAGVIPQYLFKNGTANWMVIFASNEMAITWLKNSYNISNPYWFENLTSPGVTVGVSNASLDPSGFQAIEMIKLAGILYTNWTNPYVQDAFSHNRSEFNLYNHAWNSWFGPNGTLVKDGMGSGYPQNYSLALYYQLFNYSYRHGNLHLTTEEYGLDSLLQSGSIDYALTYKSQAINQHLYYYENPAGQNGLSQWINLGNTSNAESRFYSEVNISGPSYSNIGNFPGGPILYAATILPTSKNTAEAQQLIYYLISNLGNSLLKSSDFDPLSVPFLYSQSSASIQFLNGIAQPVPSYIPASSYEDV